VTDKTPEQPRYPKPKILLMDIDSSVGAYLRKKGFNIADGSFGRKYEISQLRISGIRDNSRIPKNYAESDIVIVDLLQNHNIPEPEECDFIIDAEGRPEILIDTLSTVIDPRPIIMKRTQSNFDKILGHKGVFVIFSANKSTITGADFGATLPVAKLQRDFDLNTWSFLSVLSGTNPSWIQSQVGVEMELTDKPNILENLLRKYILESEYYCKFVNSDSHISGWLPLIKNKFNEDVAGVILSDNGFIFIFPQVKSKAAFLAEFLSDFLPEIAPQLFPYHEGKKWIHRTEYELPIVIQKLNEIERLQAETEKRIAELNSEIENERQSHQYMYDLLTETGDKLVSAVKKTLENLGFQDVVDVDEQIANDDKSKNKDEDLQITLEDGLLILTEIKGLVGRPSDDDALQVSKHLIPRMRQLNRTDIRGLFIVNHQRNLPPDSRLNGKNQLFNEPVLETSERSYVGLMTTWNLYKILRNFQKLGWQYEHIKPLFVQNGFVEPIPTHYQLIGTIDEYWKKSNAIGVNIIYGCELHRNDKIAYEFDIEFEEQVVASLQVNKTPVEVAKSGELAGIEIDAKIPIEQVRKGIRIYKALS